MTEDGRVLGQSPGRPKDLFRLLAVEKRWTGAWIAAVLLLITVTYAAAPSEDDSLTISGYVEGVTISRNTMGLHWTYFENITLDDGENSVTWSVLSPLWGFEIASLAPIPLGQQNLSGIHLDLTVIDWNGEGSVTPGDILVLRPLNGDAFDEGVPYRLSMHREPIVWDDASVDIVINFEFEDGGIISALTVDVDPGYGTVYVGPANAVEKIAGAGFIAFLILLAGAAYFMLLRPMLIRI